MPRTRSCICVVFVEATWELEGRNCAPTWLDGVGPTVLSQCALRVSCISPFDHRGSLCMLACIVVKGCTPIETVHGPGRSNVILPGRSMCCRFGCERTAGRAPYVLEGGAPGCRSQSRRWRTHSGLPMKLRSVSVHASFLLVRVTVHQVWLCVVFINKVLVR